MGAPFNCDNDFDVIAKLKLTQASHLQGSINRLVSNIKLAEHPRNCHSTPSNDGSSNVHKWGPTDCLTGEPLRSGFSDSLYTLPNFHQKGCGRRQVLLIRLCLFIPILFCWINRRQLCYQGRIQPFLRVKVSIPYAPSIKSIGRQKGGF